jgi:hypothetical protein
MKNSWEIAGKYQKRDRNYAGWGRVLQAEAGKGSVGKVGEIAGKVGVLRRAE